MPRIEAKVVVDVPIETAFWVSQSHGPTRLQWDPFVRSHTLLDAARPAKDGRTEVVSRHFIKMVSQMVSFKPPTQVGMRMLDGPWFFKSFGGGWSFADVDEGTEALWRYTFTIRPGWLRPIGEWIGSRLLQRDIDARIAAFADACLDPSVVEASLALRDADSSSDSPDAE